MANTSPISKVPDKRVVDRLLARGTLSREQLEAYLASLPDHEGELENIANRVYGSLGAHGGGGAGNEG